MASRKPNLHVPMPGTSRAGSESHGSRSSIRSPRSPRFHEIFDAPFSEAFMNDSRTTLATDSSSSSPSWQIRASLEGHGKRRTSYETVRVKSQPQPPPPAQWRQDSWASSDSTRRSSVNDRIREWARKSFVFSRKNSHPSDDGYFAQEQRPALKPNAATPTFDASPTDAVARPANPCRKSVILVGEASRPK